MAKCGCSGQTCGCALLNGVGTIVTGTGTAADPFRVAVDPSTLNFASLIRATNSNSVETVRTGSGSSTDPIIFTSTVVLRSPDNSRWGLTISNSGSITPVKL